MSVEWKAHLQTYRAAHPSLRYKTCQKRASATYKKPSQTYRAAIGAYSESREADRNLSAILQKVGKEEVSGDLDRYVRKMKESSSLFQTAKKSAASSFTNTSVVKLVSDSLLSSGVVPKFILRAFAPVQHFSLLPRRPSQLEMAKRIFVDVFQSTPKLFGAIAAVGVLYDVVHRIFTALPELTCIHNLVVVSMVAFSRLSQRQFAAFLTDTGVVATIKSMAERTNSWLQTHFVTAVKGKINANMLKMYVAAAETLVHANARGRTQCDVALPYRISKINTPNQVSIVRETCLLQSEEKDFPSVYHLQKLYDELPDRSTHASTT